MQLVVLNSKIKIRKNLHADYTWMRFDEEQRIILTVIFFHTTPQKLKPETPPTPKPTGQCFFFFYPEGVGRTMHCRVALLLLFLAVGSAWDPPTELPCGWPLVTVVKFADKDTFELPQPPATAVTFGGALQIECDVFLNAYTKNARMVEFSNARELDVLFLGQVGGGLMYLAAAQTQLKTAVIDPTPAPLQQSFHVKIIISPVDAANSNFTLYIDGAFRQHGVSETSLYTERRNILVHNSVYNVPPTDGTVTQFEMKMCALAAPTAAPDTAAPPTAEPTAAPPTAEPTPAPDTLPPATFAPDTLPPATDIPQTVAPNTSAPATEIPATLVPETLPPKTPAPQTSSPPTSAPTTSSPRTETPETFVPETGVPLTFIEVTSAPHIAEEVLQQSDAVLTTAAGGAVAGLVGTAVLGGSTLSVNGVSRMARAQLYLEMLECPRGGVATVPVVMSPSQLRLGRDVLREQRGAVVGNVATVAALCTLLLAAAALHHRTHGTPSIRASLSSMPVPIACLLLELLWTPTTAGATMLLLHSTYNTDVALGAFALLLCAAVLVWLLRLTWAAKKQYSTTRIPPRHRWDALLSARWEWRLRDSADHHISYAACVFDGYRKEHAGYFVVQLVFTGTVGVLAGWNPGDTITCAGRAGLMTSLPLLWAAILLKDRPFSRRLLCIAEVLLALLEFSFAAVAFAGVSQSDADLLDVGVVLGSWVGYAAVLKFLIDLALFSRDYFLKADQKEVEPNPDNTVNFESLLLPNDVCGVQAWGNVSVLASHEDKDKEIQRLKTLLSVEREELALLKAEAGRGAEWTTDARDIEIQRLQRFVKQLKEMLNSNLIEV